MNDSTGNAPHDHRPLELFASMARTRLELLSLDVESHLGAMVTSFMLGFAAVVLALIALAFVGVAVIAVFWDTHRVLAAAFVTIAYLAAAGLAASRAQARWAERPDPFAATLRELDLDREAVREAA